MSEFDDILNEQDDETVTETPESVETPEPATDDVEAVAESPTPATPETSAPADAAEEAQPITRESDGAVWSPNAKRWYLNGKIVAGEAPETPVEASHSSAPQAPAVETPVVPPAAPVAEPFVVRGGGQKHIIPGATIDAEGRVTIAPEMVGQIKSIIAAGIQHNQNYPRERQQYQEQIRQAEARAEARSAKYNSAATMLFDKVHDPNWLQELVADPERTLSYLRKDIGYLLKEADMSIPQAPQAQAAPAPEDLEAGFSQTLSASLDELLDDAPRGLLSAEDIAEMKATFGRRMAAYAAEVDGQVVLDFHAVRDDFQREVKMAQRAQAAAAKAAEDARKAKAAAAFNTAQAPKPAPTPTKPKPTLVPAGTKPSAPKPGWDQSFKSAWTDDDPDE